MKKIIRISLFVSAAVFMSSCSPEKDPAKAIENANKNLPVMNDTMHDMSNTTESMNYGMGDTNEAIRKQKQVLALKELLDEKNQQFTYPIPGDLMPAGQVFAETFVVKSKVKGQIVNDFKTTEFIEWVYLNLKKINQDSYENNYPDDADKKNTVQLMNFEKKKMGLLSAVTIVCGFLPDEVVADMIENFIVKSNRYRETGLRALAMRMKFYNDMMLKGSLMSEKFSTVGHLEKAVEFNSKIEKIVRLPFYPMVQLKVFGFSDEDMNKEASINYTKDIAFKNWKQIKSLSEAGYQAIGMSGDATEDAQELAEQNAKFNVLMNQVKGYISQWNSELNPTPSPTPNLTPQ